MPRLLFLTIFCFVLLITKLQGQYKLDITLNDSTKISGEFRWTQDKLTQTSTKKIYKYRDISEFIQYGENFTNHFHIIRYKRNRKNKTYRFALGYKVYSGQKIELYHAYFGVDRIDYKVKNKYNSNTEIFARKRNEKYVYSLQILDGIGTVGIMKRLEEFFTDCPRIITLVKKGMINKMKTLQIVSQYEVVCPEPF